MKNSEITFKIDKTASLVVKIQDIYEIHCCYEVPIYLVNNNIEILLTRDSLRYNLENFKNQLKKATNNELQLHESLLKKDIGFLFNQDLQNLPGLYYKTFNKSSYWIGLDLLLWNDMYAMWLYNNPEGSIVLEITSLYPKKEYNLPNQEDIAYDKWIKDYSPYLIRTISKETAKEWLTTIDDLLQQIAENVKRMENEN